MLAHQRQINLVNSGGIYDKERKV